MESSWMLMLIKIEVVKIAVLSMWQLTIMMSNYCKSWDSFVYDRKMTKYRQEKEREQQKLLESMRRNFDEEDPKVLEALREQ